MRRWKVAISFFDQGRSLGSFNVSAFQSLGFETRSPLSWRGAYAFLRSGPAAQPGWEVATQEDLLKKAYPLFRELSERSEELDGGFHRYRGPKTSLNARDLKIEQLTLAQRRTLDRHSDWPISRINAGLADAELQIAFVLIGKDLGYLDAHHEPFTGEGLQEQGR